jgi:tripartite-type tricarboxylate transporter receptor subunit TctC
MRRTCLMFSAALGLTCLTMKAEAQTYPSRPIIMVVPFAAGAPWIRSVESSGTGCVLRSVKT